ncbi:hypothetical protein MBLNU459_g6848t1 [Dothideomycetes sp. NU459]
MPFRNADTYGPYGYTDFTSPGAYPFSYDMGNDQYMSPYGLPYMSGSEPSPQQNWSPASQTQGSRSDHLSPLEASFAHSTPSDMTGTLDQNVTGPFSSTAVVPQDDMLQKSSPQMDQTSAIPDFQVYPTGLKRNASHFVETQNHHSPATTTESEVQAMKISTSPQTSVNSIEYAVAVPGDSRNSAEKSELETARVGEDVDKAEAKIRHNIVERRYRENINAQVDVLRDSIVATMQAKNDQSGSSSSFLGADELKRLTKAAVIAAATQQIKRARSDNEKLLEEHRALQAQIQQLEAQVKCGDCPLVQLTFDMGLENPVEQPP